MKRAVTMKIPINYVIKSCCVNPIKALDMYDEYGSLTIGKKTDILILNKDLSIKTIIKHGTIIQ